MPSNVFTSTLPADPARDRLASYFTALVADGHEGVLATQGVENRSSTVDLITMAALRAAEAYVFLQALLPDPTILPANPAEVSKAVLLASLEVAELAIHHDKVAAEAERQGDHDTAQRRRDRAEQMRAILSGATI